MLDVASLCSLCMHGCADWSLGATSDRSAMSLLDAQAPVMVCVCTSVAGECMPKPEVTQAILACMHSSGVAHSLPLRRAARARGCSPLTSVSGTPVPASMLMGTRIQGKTGKAFDLSGFGASSWLTLAAISSQVFLLRL